MLWKENNNKKVLHGFVFIALWNEKKKKKKESVKAELSSSSQVYI